MVEGSEGGGPGPGPGPEAGFVSKSALLFESAGDRLRFEVKLQPGETTIVSWKKLLREANSSKSNRPGPSISGLDDQHHSASQPPPPPSHVAPVFLEPSTGKEHNDSQVQAGSNRLSNIIERIERMYAGNGSSGEEDVMLDNVPDDDEYDTNDSFIDDVELDDYFQVDNSAIKHHGFFVNRGKLERIEPTISANQQPKKRRRKDLTKGHTESDDGHNPKKIAKLGNKGRKASSLIQSNSTTQSHRVVMPNIHGADMQFQTAPANAAEVSIKKKTADLNVKEESSGLSNGVRHRPEVLSSKNHSSKGEHSEPQTNSTHRSNGKSLHASKAHSERQLDNVDDLDQLIQQNDKGGIVAGFDLNVPASRDSMPTMKAALTPGKEGSNVRPKSTSLEKAIIELEKIVAEYRPPSAEVQDPDNPSPTVKRRLPSAIKQKLAKVARLAQGSYGKIPMDVINRLMSIVGHLMQINTLKRNLKVMANMGLSAKKEKDDQIEKIKQEVTEMVKQRIPYMKSKAEQQAANSDDFQEAGPEEREALKRKYSMDDVLGNKICDLHDLYVERIEEDSGPSIRRLYQELLVLWPTGFMDIDGIKRAIYRAKERRELCSSRKDRDKIRKKKLLPPKSEDVSKGTKALHTSEKLLSDSCSTLNKKPVLSAGHGGVAFVNGPKVDRRKQDKAKINPNGNKPIDEMQSNILSKKKIKKKPSTEALEAKFLLEKLVVSKSDEQPNKHHKHVAQST
ncbi:hypothetical protein OROHE_023622 [Orobanche hederae]